MERHSLLDPGLIANDHEGQTFMRQEGAFAGQWQPDDTAHLQPSNLAIPRIQRAWERKPSSPFSKHGSRVAKVWKRSASSHSTVPGAPAAPGSKTARKRKSRVSASSPHKPVKKLRLDSNFGMGARVSQFDASASPVRKIATRSSAGPADIVALAEENEQSSGGEEDDGTTVEIVNEDGTIVQSPGEDLVDSGDWEDDAEVGDESQDEPFEPTLTHLGDLENDSEEFGFSAPPRVVETTQVKPQVILPEGFVTPVKRRPRPKRGEPRPISGLRRQTLPTDFSIALSSAPSAVASQHEVCPEKTIVGGEDESDSQSQHGSADHAQGSPDAHGQTTHESVKADSSGDEWEDLNDPAASSAVPGIGHSRLTSDGDIMPEAHDLAEERASAELGVEQDQNDRHAVDASLGQQDGENYTGASSAPTELGDAEITDVSSVQIPLRSSPRRKSTSPLKRGTTLNFNDKPHYVACTPIRALSASPFASSITQNFSSPSEQYEANGDAASPVFERASSAPPEEPHMTTQRPAKPRISDDTALLEAFLNRAAENKSSRRVSNGKRESLTNKRDSDAVRTALASPAKADVLGDLDPNSPSPRKPVALTEHAGPSEKVDFPVAQDEAAAEETRPAQRARRSGRATRKSHQPNQGGPNRIAIRGNSDNVVLKKSEAQELSLLTRNNTRKNKGGSIYPQLRLTKMAAQAIQTFPEPAEELDERPPALAQKRGPRSVTWAETLVEFYRGSDEISVVADEGEQPSPEPDEEPDASGTSAEQDEPADATPLPPAETPSKPKIRRLKAPRTASSSRKAEAKPAELPAESSRVEGSDVSETISSQSKHATAPKRRSRIATPAKGLRSSASEPPVPEARPTPSAQPVSEPGTKKKAPGSRLPARATSSALGQGKENLTSSPPKKRSMEMGAGAITGKPSFAPKLDLGSATKLEPASGAPTGPLGLASPAKKAGVRRAAPQEQPGQSLYREQGRAEETAGLRSPAKKRTRRGIS